VVTPAKAPAGSVDTEATPPSLAAPTVFLAVVGACYGFVLPFGVAGHVAGGLAGALWAVFLIWGLRWVLRAASSWPFSELALSLTLTCLAAVLAGGWLYNRMFAAVLGEPIVTGETLAAMMAPSVPFFVALNSALELMLFPVLLALCARRGVRAAVPVAAAAIAYLAMRVWTYAVFAAPRVEMTAAPLAPADIAWFERTLAADYRIHLLAAALVAILWAATSRVRRASHALPD
jgi:hypothetical protein